MIATLSAAVTLSLALTSTGQRVILCDGRKPPGARALVINRPPRQRDLEIGSIGAAPTATANALHHPAPLRHRSSRWQVKKHTIAARKAGRA